MEENIKPLSPRQALHHNNSLGVYYHRDRLSVGDVKSILTLLSNNPKSHNLKHYKEGTSDNSVFTENPIEIAKDDRYKLKAYFFYNPTNFLKQVGELKVVESRKELLAQGQVTFITTFQPQNDMMEENYHLILTVEDILHSPAYEPRNGKINVGKNVYSLSSKEGKTEKLVDGDKRESSQTLEKESPYTPKKRSASLSSVYQGMRTTLSSPSFMRRKGKGTVSPQHQQKSVTPTVNRNRSATSPAESPVVTPPPKSKKSLSFRKDKGNLKQNASLSPIVKRNIKGTQERKELHKSKSYPDLQALKEKNQFKHKVIVTPLQPRTSVRKMVENIEKSQRVSKE